MIFRLLTIATAALVPLLCGNSARAVVLDWDAVTWTPGYTNSFDVDGQQAGNDITISVAGDTSTLQYSTPALATQFQGGLATTEKTLVLGVDFANQTQSILVTVNFSALYTQGVENVSFTLFDVDFDNQKNSSEYQDQLRSISALDINGVQIAPTITWSANNTRTGSGLAQIVDGTATTADSGAGSGNGNVTISFGTTAIQSFTFRYGSGTGTDANPTYQHVGIHDINFTPVPELNPAAISFGLCGIVAAWTLRRHTRRRRGGGDREGPS